MSAYFLAQITIRDEATYAKYLDGFDEIFARFQGEVVAVDDAPTVLEGQWHRGRVVLIRFPDEQELRRWYESPEYQALARFRQAASDADILLVHGR
ncbi:MAG TPA: DUF1330 domain-containing protein [Symbiobacteriaceae bacterium]|nr:DUF1330 domain-containing protein [Symbiobacteriaceae bacterium]